MAEIGQWEKAIALAPSVSIEFWQQLSAQYAKHLVSTENDECVPFLIGTGEIDILLQFLTRRNQFDDSIIIAQANSEGSFPVSSKISSPVSDQSLPLSPSTPGTPGSPQTVGEFKISQTSSGMANVAQLSALKYMREAFPVLAATMYLSINEYGKAIKSLIQGNEVLLAYAMLSALKSVHSEVCSS
jgi:hypothetical protein